MSSRNLRIGSTESDLILAFFFTLLGVFLLVSGLLYWTSPNIHKQKLEDLQQEAVDLGYAERYVGEDNYAHWRWVTKEPADLVGLSD